MAAHRIPYVATATVGYPDDLARCVLYWEGVRAHPADFAVRADDPVFLVKGAEGLPGKGGEDTPPVFRVYQIDERSQPFVEALAGKAEDLLVCRAAVDDLGGVGRGDPEDLVDVFRELAELLLALLQVPQKEETVKAVRDPAADLLVEPHLLVGPVARVRALVHAEDPWAAELRVDGREEHRADVKEAGGLLGQCAP